MPHDSEHLHVTEHAMLRIRERATYFRKTGSQELVKMIHRGVAESVVVGHTTKHRQIVAAKVGHSHIVYLVIRRYIGGIDVITCLTDEMVAAHMQRRVKEQSKAFLGYCRNMPGKTPHRRTGRRNNRRHYNPDSDE